MFRLALLALLAVCVPAGSELGHAPEITSFQVAPLRGETGLGSWMATEFEFAVSCHDLDGDPPTGMSIDIEGPIHERMEYDTATLARVDMLEGCTVRVRAGPFSRAGAYRATVTLSDKDDVTQSQPVAFLVESTATKWLHYLWVLAVIYLAMVLGRRTIAAQLGAKRPALAKLCLMAWALLGWVWTVWWWRLDQNRFVFIAGSLTAVVLCWFLVSIQSVGGTRPGSTSK